MDNNPGILRDCKLAQILMDLDRCEHGRHAADSCFNCPGGHSAGNPHLERGAIIGYRYTGAPIRVPDSHRGEHTSDVDAWRTMPS